MAQSAMASRSVHRKPDRRRHSRFPLGLPVEMRLVGRDDLLTVELMDLSKGGGRFRFAGADVAVDQQATFGFVIPEQRRCTARGRVLRVEGPGQFVLSLEHANEAFISFVKGLAI